MNRATQGRRVVANYPQDHMSCIPADPLVAHPSHDAEDAKPPADNADQDTTDSSTSPVSVTDCAADLAALLGRCRTVLHRISQETASAVWGVNWAADEPDPCADLDRGVDLVAGRGNVARRLAWLHDLPTRHLITMRSEPVPQNWSARSEFTAADQRLLDRKVSLREIYPCPSGLSAQQHRFLLQRHSAGIGLRLKPTVPTDLMIIDRAVAVLPVDPDRPGWALAVVTNRVWVRAAQQIADVCWNSATEYATDPPGTFSARAAGGVRAGAAGVHGSAHARVE